MPTQFLGHSHKAAFNRRSSERAESRKACIPFEFDTAATREVGPRLADASVRCWGYGANGQMGYCNTDSAGDDETPGSVGPINLVPGDGGAACGASPGPPAGGGGLGPVPGGGGGPATAPGGGGPRPKPGTAATKPSVRHPVNPLALQAGRARGLRRCLAQAAHRAKRRRNRARRGCLKRARSPGLVTRAHARSRSDISSSSPAARSAARAASGGPDALQRHLSLQGDCRRHPDHPHHHPPAPPQHLLLRHRRPRQCLRPTRPTLRDSSGTHPLEATWPASRDLPGAAVTHPKAPR